MAELPFMPLSVEAWDAGTSHLTDAEDGLYGRLVRALWQMPNQRFPNDDAWLARRFRRTVEQVQSEVRPLFAEFFQTDGNWITHKRVTKEFRRARKTTKQRSEAAKARWNKEKAACESNTEKSAPAVILTHTLTPTHTPTEESPHSPPKGGETTEAVNGKSGRKREARGTRIDPHWLPDAADRAYAEGFDLNADVVGEEFRNYWVGVPGAKGRKLDWSATFRNRCIQLAGAARRGAGGNGAGNGSRIETGGDGFVAAAERVARRRGLVVS